MGYYIETSANHGKAEEIAKRYSGEIVTQAEAEEAFNAYPDEEAVIVVVDNGPFEAAAFAYNKREFDAFVDPQDKRPKKFVIIDRSKAIELTGYIPR